MGTRVHCETAWEVIPNRSAKTTGPPPAVMTASIDTMDIMSKHCLLSGSRQVPLTVTPVRSPYIISNMKSLRERMRHAWHASGITQVAIAERCKVKRESVSQWVAVDESKGTSPTNDNLACFAEITGYELRWLLTGHGPKTINEPHEVREPSGPAYRSQREIDPDLLGECMNTVRDLLAERGIPRTDPAWTEQSVLTLALNLYQRTETTDASARGLKKQARDHLEIPLAAEKKKR